MVIYVMPLSFTLSIPYSSATTDNLFYKLVERTSMRGRMIKIDDDKRGKRDGRLLELEVPPLVKRMEKYLAGPSFGGACG